LKKSAKKIETLSCGWKKKLPASSIFTPATIALRNSPSWNCRPRLKLYPKRENPRQQLAKSHAPRERSDEGRQGGMSLVLAQDMAASMGSPFARHTWRGRCAEPVRDRFVAEADREYLSAREYLRC